jgi:hypothetical protein
MQVNEQATQGQKASRLPDMERAFDDARAKLETQERLGAYESRRLATPQVPYDGDAGTTIMPRRYGSGF